MNTVLPNILKRLQGIGLVSGLVCLVLSGIGFALDRRQFYISYLFGYTYWLGLALGCLGVSMMHHLSGGQWGFVTRRFLEAGYLTLPMLAVLFVPIGMGLRELYPWARPEVVAASHILAHKQSYLSPAAWGARAVFFFAIWIVLAAVLRRGSLQQDRTHESGPTVRMRAWSGPGMVIYPLTGTFAFVDWMMSLEPEWHSTVFLVIVLIGQILGAFAWVTLMLYWTQDQPPFHGVVNADHFHDLGNLLLAFVIFWTYVSFGQLLIIYSGNLPLEISWYLHRIAGGWKGWVVAVVLFYFLAPFFLLLFRDIKRHPRGLAAIAVLILAAQVVAHYWMIVPAFYPDGPKVHWQDLAAWAGLGGFWVACFSAILRRQALLPQNDPRMVYAMALPAHEP
jgi:hypothetical protein